MPEFEFGNMWNAFDDTDAFCITTNSYLRNDGELVMGRGIASQAKKIFDDLPLAFGNRIKDSCGHLGTYGVMPSNRNEADQIIAFQVKTHFRNDADLGLIDTSASKLSELAMKYPGKRFDLNFPGIGNGSRDESEVMPLIKGMPNNIHIWRFDHQK